MNEGWRGREIKEEMRNREKNERGAEEGWRDRVERREKEMVGPSLGKRDEKTRERRQREAGDVR